MTILQFRPAAVTTEQVVYAGRCRVHGLNAEAATNAGVVTLRDDYIAKPVAPTNPAANGVDTGGSLAAATYYAKITAIDYHGYESAPSTEVNSGALADSNNHVELTWDAMDNAVSYRIYFGTVSNTLPKYFTSTTNSFDLTTTTGQLTATIPSATTTETVKLALAAGALLPSGRDLHGAEFFTGLTLQMATAADMATVEYEPISGRDTAIYSQPG